ncbi:MAG: EF-hand domain-containing protein [Massilia sp.]
MKTLILTLTMFAASAMAQQPVINPGPSLPPGLRTPSSAPPASGQALRAEALQKLKKRFEEADLDSSGSLTREEAERAGLGFVVAKFDEIDTSKRGKVNFDEVRKFMQQRRR